MSAVGADPTPAQPLSAQQVEDYHERGFLRLEAITTGAEVEALRDVYDRLFEPGAEIDPADRVELADATAQSLPQILNPDRYAPELLETDAYREASDIARQLLGPGAERMGLHAIRKPAHTGAETPWHQDEAYWDPSFEHRALSIWVPLQPATVENGCLQFVPGSHRDELRDHVLIDEEAADGLRVREPASVTGAVACPLPSGGATVHAARTLHYAGANGTGEVRRALIMAFRLPPVWRGRRTLPWQPSAWYAEG